MKIRLSLTLDLARTPKPTHGEPVFEHRDTDTYHERLPEEPYYEDRGTGFRPNSRPRTPSLTDGGGTPPS